MKQKYLIPAIATVLVAAIAYFTYRHSGSKKPEIDNSTTRQVEQKTDSGTNINAEHDVNNAGRDLYKADHDIYIDVGDTGKKHSTKPSKSHQVKVEGNNNHVISGDNNSVEVNGDVTITNETKFNPAQWPDLIPEIEKARNALWPEQLLEATFLLSYRG